MTRVKKKKKSSRQVKLFERGIRGSSRLSRVVWGAYCPRLSEAFQRQTVSRRLPQYYKPPPHHKGREPIYTLPQYHKPPPQGGNPLLPPPIKSGAGPADAVQYTYLYIYIYICTQYIYIYIYIYMYICI